MRKATAFLLAILMIALTACTGNTTMPVESGETDSMTIGDTDDMPGTTPPSEETETTNPTPSMNPVELVFAYEYLSAHVCLLRKGENTIIIP